MSPSRHAGKKPKATPIILRSSCYFKIAVVQEVRRAAVEIHRVAHEWPPRACVAGAVRLAGVEGAVLAHWAVAADPAALQAASWWCVWPAPGGLLAEFAAATDRPPTCRDYLQWLYFLTQADSIASTIQVRGRFMQPEPAAVHLPRAARPPLDAVGGQGWSGSPVK